MIPSEKPSVVSAQVDPCQVGSGQAGSGVQASSDVRTPSGRRGDRADALGRRDVIAAGLGLGLAGLASTASAQGVRSRRGIGGTVPQGGGYYRFALGEIELIVIADGNLRLGGVSQLFGGGVDSAVVEAEARMGQGVLREPMLTQCNQLVVRSGGRSVLIDSGCGDSFGPTAGAMVTHLGAAGVDASQLSMIFVTHAHPDHVGGLIQHESILGNIPVAIGRTEYEFWSGATVDDLQGMRANDEGRQGVIATARRAFDGFRDRRSLVNDGEELIPGVKAIALPGHTPGHMGVEITAGDQTLIFAGDAVTHAYLSFKRPEWSFAFDAQPEAATATRRSLLGRIAASEGRIRLLSTHVSFPSLGDVSQQGSSFTWHPATWDWNRGG